MNNKRWDYLSGVFRNIGFAFFAPLGSLLFQWLVFRKNIFEGQFYFSSIVFIFGIIFILIGCIILKEEEKKK